MPHPLQKLTPAAIAVIFALGVPAYSQAESHAAQPFNLPAQSLVNSLQQLAQKTNSQLLFAPGLLQGKNSAALSGTMTPRQALDKLLVGTGLSAEIKAGGTIIIKPQSKLQDKASVNEEALTTVKVSAMQRQQAFAEVSMGKKELMIARGTGNADIFSSQTNIQVNNGRNEAGAIDIGIRNLQGEGRVPVVIDGSLQSTHTGRGYQGNSDRTYIDSDLISAIKIHEGISNDVFSSGAIGGLVKMRTLEVQDVIKPGQSFGLMLKGSTENNNKKPDIPADELDQQYYVVQNSLDEKTFNNGSMTIATAYQQDNAEALLAYSKRKTGNYFAGSQGYEKYIKDKHESNYPPVDPRQEVVNTSFESNSLLAKLGFKIGNDQRASLIYRNHQQKAGEVMAAYWYKNSNDKHFNDFPSGVESMPQWQLGTADVQVYSTNYAYTPSDNPLIDLDIGIWANDAKLSQRNGLGAGIANASYGDQYIHHFKNKRNGITVNNTSELQAWPLSLNYGLSIARESIIPLSFNPDALSAKNSARHANRQERSLLINGTLKTPRITMFVGANIHDAEIKDHAAGINQHYGEKVDLNAKLDIRLNHWAEIYLAGGQAYRLPSLYEGSTSTEVFNYDPKRPLQPEKLVNYEIGTRLSFEQLLNQHDKLTVKTKYFNSKVHNYISTGAPNWNFSFINYDLFQNHGYELDVDYKTPSFYIDATATFYEHAKVCSAQIADSRKNTARCNSLGFAWSQVPSHISPRKVATITVGKTFMDNTLSIGSRLRYHASKSNPKGWLQGTGARPAQEVPSRKILDLFAEYRLAKDLSTHLNINNVTNQYAIEPGSLISMPMPGRTIRVGFEGKF